MRQPIRSSRSHRRARSHYWSEASVTYSRKDISNFKLRKGNPIGVMVTLRREKMAEFPREINPVLHSHVFVTLEA